MFKYDRPNTTNSPMVLPNGERNRMNGFDVFILFVLMVSAAIAGNEYSNRTESRFFTMLAVFSGGLVMLRIFWRVFE